MFDQALRLAGEAEAEAARRDLISASFNAWQVTGVIEAIAAGLSNRRPRRGRTFARYLKDMGLPLKHARPAADRAAERAAAASIGDRLRRAFKERGVRKASS